MEHPEPVDLAKADLHALFLYISGDELALCISGHELAPCNSDHELSL